jgi:hypothetical protein
MSLDAHNFRISRNSRHQKCQYIVKRRRFIGNGAALRANKPFWRFAFIGDKHLPPFEILRDDKPAKGVRRSRHE